MTGNGRHAAARPTPRAATHVFGQHERVLRATTGRWSFRIHRRTATVCVLLAAILLLLLLAALMLGEYRVTPEALAQTLLGNAPDNRTEFFVLGRRLPRALVAVTVGAMLALAGAIFQALTRNPLASPDVIGISSGASVGAVIAMLVLGGGLAGASVGAAIGAVTAAATLILITHRTGLHGVQLVLVGVAIAAIAMAVVDYVLSQVFVASATTAQTWLVGSLQGKSWGALVLAVIGLAVAVPLLVWQAPAARMVAMGEGLATGVGVRTQRSRWILLATGTLLVAVAVATAGPISFVALVSPHLARSLTRATSFVAAAAMGALLLLASDLLALYAFTAPIPVGAVTVTLGGGFFLWLLWREGRARV